MNVRLNVTLILCISVSFLVLVACKKGQPKGVIAPSEMEDVLYDYHIAQAMADNLPYGEVYKKKMYTEYVFGKHHITQAQFDSSMVWYTREAEMLTKIYEQVNKRMKDQRDALNHQIALRDKKPVMTQKGDTVDIWYKDRFYSLTDLPASNKVLFEIPGDENFKIGDELCFKVHFTFPGNRSKDKYAYMAMAIRLENDSVVSKVLPVNRTGLSTIRLQPDSCPPIKGITGFVYYAGNRAKESMLLLDRISLIRYHKPAKSGVLPASPPPADKKTVIESGGIIESKRVNEVEVRDTTSQKALEMENKPVRMNPRELDRPRVKRP